MATSKKLRLPTALARYRQGLLLISQALAVLLLASAASAGAEISFEPYELHTGIARHQTVLTGFFLAGEMTEIAVVYVDEEGLPQLRLFAFVDQSWKPWLDARLSPEVSFIDVANIDGRERILTHAPGRLSWFDPESGEEHPLVEVESSYNVIEKGEIPRIDITRDLNKDGRDDLVLPDPQGFWIAIQLIDGSFAEPVRLGPAEPFLDEIVTGEKRSYREVGLTTQTIPWYLSRVHAMDYNQDGRSDLVFWNEDHLDIHLQEENGLFDPLARTFTVDIPFDSDGAYSRLFDFSDQGALNIVFGVGKKTTRKVLHVFRDMNGDGVADLVTLTLAGRTIANQRSLYEVHLGAASPNGTLFSKDASTAIQPRGRAAGMQPRGYSSQWLADDDGDGQIDALFLDVKVGIGGMMRALLGNSVPIDLEHYRMEDGIYPDKPTARRKIRRFDPLDGLGNVFFPVVLMGDVSGDGRSDLLVGQSPEELQIFVARSGSSPLALQPQKVKVALPYDERNTWLTDLNKDGRQDLVVHHGPTDHSPTETHRVTLLLSTD